MKKLKAIYRILTRKNFIVFTADQAGYYSFEMRAHPKHIVALCENLSSAMNRKAEALETEEAVETAKNIIAGAL